MQSYSLPSNTYDDLTLGANGSEYIAPADGWFAIRGSTTNVVNFLELLKLKSDNNIEYAQISRADSVTNQGVSCILPVLKNYKIRLDYSGVNILYFRFVYANGAQQS